MSTDWTAAEQDAIRKLLERAENDPAFTSDEKRIIRQMVDVVRALNSLGRLAKWVIFILAAIAGAMTAWAQIRDGLMKWWAG